MFDLAPLRNGEIPGPDLGVTGNC